MRLTLFSLIAVLLTIMPAMAADPLLELTYPNGGEELSVGHEVNIAWTTSDPDGAGIDHAELWYSSDDGANWVLITNSVAGGGGGDYTYAWTVPDDVSDECQIWVRVIDGGAEQADDQSDANFSIVKNNPVVDVSYPNGFEYVRVADRIEITWFVSDPDNDDIDSTEVWYTSDGAGSWDKIGAAYGDDTDLFWTIPDDVSSDCKVWVRAWDETGVYGDDQSDDWFDIVDAEMASHHFSAGWSLISFPVIPGINHNTVEEIFDDDFIRLYQVIGWAPDRGHFFADTIANGQAYFLGCVEDEELDITHYSVNTADSHEWDLVRGWNLIGTPWFSRVDMNDGGGDDAIVTVAGHDPISFGEAVNREIVGPVGYNFFQNIPNELEDGQSLQRYYEHQELLPWRGYWFMAMLDDVSIEVFPTSAYPTINGADEATPDRWSLEVLAVTGSVGDAVRIGADSRASEGFDKIFDWAEPPEAPIDNPLSFRFEYGNWGARAGENFTSDIRGVLNRGQSAEWNAHLIGSATDEAILVWIDFENSIPQGEDVYYEYYIVDHDNDVTVNMREHSTYEFAFDGDAEFTIRVESALELPEGNTETPVAFGLNKIYPNPFNNQTTIEYQVEHTGAVELAVFDLAGRLVDNLVSGSVQAGSHSVTFNADGVDSGVYIVQLSNGQQAQTQKLILIK